MTDRMIGRVQRKLIALLNDAGFTDVRLAPASGYYRTDRRADVYRWTGSAKTKENGFEVQLASWSTMTECVRGGIEIACDGAGLEVWAKERAS